MWPRLIKQKVKIIDFQTIVILDDGKYVKKSRDSQDFVFLTNSCTKFLYKFYFSVRIVKCVGHIF